MAFDFKKEYKEFYLPPAKPGIVRVPAASFIAVRGAGNPNREGGAYADALEQLYGVAYTIKMSKMDKSGASAIEGYFDYVVPPLEGFWWQEGAGEGEGEGAVAGIDYARKDEFNWISCIRVPSFVTPEVVAWAREAAAKKKGRSFVDVEFWTHDEGLCVQCMHLGPYDDEPATVESMHAFAAARDYVPDFTDVPAGNAAAAAGARMHHEIYLSDPRRTAPEKLKTVIRHPVRPAELDPFCQLPPTRLASETNGAAPNVSFAGSETNVAAPNVSLNWAD